MKKRLTRLCAVSLGTEIWSSRVAYIRVALAAGKGLRVGAAAFVGEFNAPTEGRTSFFYSARPATRLTIIF